MNRVLMLTTVIGVGLASTMLRTQVQERSGQVPSPGESLVGKVTSVGKDSLVILPLTGGSAVTVNVTDATRLMKDRQPLRLTDIKTDDVVFVRGQTSGSTLAAAVVAVMNPEMAQRIQQGGGMIGFGAGRGNGGETVFRGGAGAFKREDLGKKFIAGEVKAINETKLTIARPDGQSQEIEVDENTSFKRGNESITLPDIKVGDFVRGSGELKNSIFVPKELLVGRPQIRMMITEPQGNPPSDKPSTQTPPKD